jgi:hypothetical protein
MKTQGGGEGLAYRGARGPKNSATMPGRRRGTVAVDEDLREEERGLTSVRAFWP